MPRVIQNGAATGTTVLTVLATLNWVDRTGSNQTIAVPKRDVSFGQFAPFIPSFKTDIFNA